MSLDRESQIEMRYAAQPRHRTVLPAQPISSRAPPQKNPPRFGFRVTAFLCECVLVCLPVSLTHARTHPLTHFEMARRLTHNTNNPKYRLYGAPQCLAHASDFLCLVPRAVEGVRGMKREMKRACSGRALFTSRSNQCKPQHETVAVFLKETTCVFKSGSTAVHGTDSVGFKEIAVSTDSVLSSHARANLCTYGSSPRQVENVIGASIP